MPHDDEMRAQIDRILSGVEDKTVNKIGDLWQIRVGKRAGARKDGISLARDLLRARKAEADPESAAMNAAMAQEKAVHKAEPEVRYVPDPEAEKRYKEAEGKLQDALAKMEQEDPETKEQITNLERAIQEAQARAEAAESKLAQAQYQEPEGDFKFKVPFLQTERKVNEDLSDADRRLFEEYSNLELRRPLEPNDDSRWRSLQAGLFDFKG